MASDRPDLEKQESAPPHQAKPSTASSDLSTSSIEVDLPTKKTRTEIRRSSLDSNPLSPLERALGDPISTADIEIPDSDDDDDNNNNDENNNNAAPLDLNLARTRTSIISSASRPPDYEVTLEADDPENPRNWYTHSFSLALQQYNYPLTPHTQAPLVPRLHDPRRLVRQLGRGPLQHELHGHHRGHHGRV